LILRIKNMNVQLWYFKVVLFLLWSDRE